MPHKRYLTAYYTNVLDVHPADSMLSHDPVFCQFTNDQPLPSTAVHHPGQIKQEPSAAQLNQIPQASSYNPYVSIDGDPFQEINTPQHQRQRRCQAPSASSTRNASTRRSQHSSDSRTAARLQRERSPVIRSPYFAFNRDQNGTLASQAENIDPAKVSNNDQASEDDALLPMRRIARDLGEADTDGDGVSVAERVALMDNLVTEIRFKIEDLEALVSVVGDQIRDGPMN